MALFGSFETEREVYSDPIYTVYSAKKSGEANADYAVKVFSMQGVGFDPDEATDLAPLLVDIESSRSQCIEAQAQAASSSKYIAPVFEKGQDERGVWYATRFYPRSVNKIIVGKVALSREAVLHLTRSIAQGALDFKRACGRSHGDILPSNVQISRSEKLSEAETVLCDPMPGGAEEAVTFEVNDLRNIGRILLQLVQQRAINNEDDFLILPILSSPQWTSLFGKDSETWLNLCNRLLDPNLSLDQMTLERLVAELEALQPKAGVSPKVFIGAAAGVLLLLSSLAVLLLRPRLQEIIITSDPPGATILVDKKEQATVAPLRLKLKKAKYEIVATYSSLGSQTTNLTVSGAQELPFRFAYGSLVLKSEPPNAEVELDGKKIGNTPYTSGPLSPGDRAYTLRLTNYDQFKLSVTIASNGQVVSPPIAKLNARKPGDVEVEISSRPDAATVEESGQDFGRTPLIKSLAPSLHKLTAHFPGWPEFTISTQFVAGATSTILFDFPFATVSFDGITPSDALVTLNSKPLGLARDLTSKRLPPGEYSVTVTNAGFYPAEQKLTLRKDARERPQVRLKPMEGVVEFTSDPPGAMIFDLKDPSKSLGKTELGKLLSLPFKPGPYSFLARYPGLDDARTTVVNVDLGKTLQQTLKFDYGTVKFDSIPPQADLIITGATTNRTPYTYLQKPGTLNYRIEAADYYPEEGATNVVPGKALEISRRLRPRDVNVVLQSDPPGAQFYVGQNKIPGTNDVFAMPWGSYSITARFASLAGLPELDPVTQSVEVDKSGKTTSNFEFKYGTLEITNEAPDAQLSYQGRALASLPARLLIKPELSGDIVVEYGEFRTNLSARLAPRDLKKIGVVLPEQRRLYTNSLGMVLVRVNQDLYVGQFEVTEQQYRALRNEPLQVLALSPAVDVPWEDAKRFCETLSGRDKDSLSRQKLAGWTYGLPTSKEWRFYAEATPEVIGNSSFSTKGRSGKPDEISYARKSAGKLSIYDVFGNVDEWGISDTGKATTTGGNITNKRPLPARAYDNNQENPSVDTIKDGSPVIGFRCVLRKSPP